MKTMQLTYPWPDRDSNRVDLYRVEAVTDSLKPAVHSFLTAKQAEEYCSARDWKVTIKP
jgi:hypothetical protein